jgi:hypothetical protein
MLRPDKKSAYEAIFNSKNLSEAEEGELGIFETRRLVKVEGAPETVAFTIQAPQEEWQVKAMEERGGLLLGDMIVGGISMLAPGGGASSSFPTFLSSHSTSCFLFW